MPLSDTQESPSTAITSKMATLQPDIMFEIADILKADNYYYYPEVPVITRLSLINKHWEAHMKLNSLFSTAYFDLTRPDFGKSKRASFKDVKEWLMHPNRRHKLIRSLSIHIDRLPDYHDLCDLLDNQLSDVKFNTFKLVARKDRRHKNRVEEQVQFPRSLKARQLIITNNRRQKGFNWESLNLSLRDNLVSLDINDKLFLPHNSLIAFKSLKELHIHSVKDSVIHEWNDFLRRHSSINSLSVYGLCDSFFISDSYRLENELPLKIDSLHNLKTLRLFKMPVDTESGNIQRVPLKSLAYSGCKYPTRIWTSLSNTLEKLDICANGDCEWDHDLANPKMLCKLNNIKRFRLTGMDKMLKFPAAFNSGLYDNAMPLIEDLELSGSRVSKKALYRFVDKHKRLCRIDVQCYKKRYTGNPREVCV